MRLSRADPGASRRAFVAERGPAAARLTLSRDGSGSTFRCYGPLVWVFRSRTQGVVNSRARPNLCFRYEPRWRMTGEVQQLSRASGPRFGPHRTEHLDGLLAG